MKDDATGRSNACLAECVPNKVMFVRQISSQDEVVENPPLDKVAFDQPTQRMASPARVEKAGLHSDNDPTAVAFDEQWNWHSLDGCNALTTEAIEFQHAPQRRHPRGLRSDRGFRRKSRREERTEAIANRRVGRAVTQMLIVIVPKAALA